MLMIANSQGAEKFLCRTRTHCLEQDVRHMGGMEYQDPDAHDFPVGGMSAGQSARFTPSWPDSGCQRLFQTIKVAHMILMILFSQMQKPRTVHQTIMCARASMWNFLAGMRQYMTQIASPIRTALSRTLMAARKAMDQSNARKTLKPLVPLRVRASSWRIVKRCSGLTQKAKHHKFNQ